MNKNKIAITLGDYNGIGPEVTVKALNKISPNPQNIIIIGAKKLLKNLNKEYTTIDVPFDVSDLQYGKETAKCGEFSYNCLTLACKLAKAKEIKAIVTAPVSKNALHLAGHNYSGQTEILEENLSNPSLDEKAEMLFASKDFRVLLLTRHIALNRVNITQDLLKEKILRINRVLKNNFQINEPQIALCALNPHAGENGILGKEEIEIFNPILNELRSKGINITNPMPADTLFVKASKPYLSNGKQPYDVYCACYHDQGLIPIKVLAMDSTVNMTVGLSIIRTSPAHGTAYDIAGKGIANENSMVCAIESALKHCITT